jgi:hypothetical protein
MGFFSWLGKRSKTTEPLPCPRCLGKGHVDEADIIRLRQQGKWGTGTCAYCNGSGKINQDMLSKVPVDATYFTTNLSESDRSFIINNNYKRNGCPVTEHNRIWLEDAFLVLQDLFGKTNTQNIKVLLPNFSNFPVPYDGTEQSAVETMRIVATHMQVSFENIHLDFYKDIIREVPAGGPFGNRIFPERHKDDLDASGLYWGKNEDGKFEIWLNSKTLSVPENLVATLAHEIAHIKLLGENRMIDNNEYLTDLTTVIFGLGIFNANEAFRTFKNFEYSYWQAEGYLSQPQWGYALALFAYLRGEKSPDWINHLTPNIKKDFLQSQQFIYSNPQLVFHQE